MRRVIIGGLALSLVGLTAPAALAAEPAAAKAAKAADPATERAILRLIKRAERAGYERHDKKRYFKAFTQDATWIKGRRPVAGEYDLTWSRAEYERYIGLEWDLAPSGRDRMFFHEEQVELEGDRARVEVEIRRSFFGGDSVEGAAYELRKGKRGWQIAQRRMWPKAESIGVESFKFHDEAWLALDEQLALKEGSEAVEGLARTVVLVRAYRFQEAYELAKSLAAKPRLDGMLDVPAVLAHASLAIEVKRIDEAIEVVRTARKSDPSIQAPLKLRRLIPRKLDRR